MKTKRKNMMLVLICVFSAALVTFAFIRAALPVSAAPTGGEIPPMQSEGGEPPARPDGERDEGGTSAPAPGGDTDAPITDNRITEEGKEPLAMPSGNTGRRPGGDGGTAGAEGREPAMPGEENRGDDRILLMILAAAGSAAFAASLALLIAGIATKSKEKLAKGDKTLDTDLPIRTN